MNNCYCEIVAGVVILIHQWDVSEVMTDANGNIVDHGSPPSGNLIVLADPSIQPDVGWTYDGANFNAPVTE
jgi:hypothetical protein